MRKPSFNKPSVDMKKFRDFKVRISQIPPMDVAFESMAISEYELLVATIYRLNELIKHTNSYTELIDEILEWVLNEGLEQAVLDKLNVWLNDGTLEVLINETLFNMKLDKTEFEEYKLLVSQTLEDLEIIINGEISRIDGELEDLDTDIQEINEQLEDNMNYHVKASKFGISTSNEDNHDNFMVAFDYLESKGGGTLELPFGVIKTSPLDFENRNNIVIKGIGRSYPLTSNTTIKIVGNNPVGSVGLKFSKVTDLSVEYERHSRHCKLAGI